MRLSGVPAGSRRGEQPSKTSDLRAPPSRWLWLFKWILVFPHYLVLGFLWVAFVVLSAAAMVAIVVTGRYTRPAGG